MSKTTNINEKEYLEVDLHHLVHTLLRRAWIIILSTILVGVLVFCYISFAVPPKYTANAMLYVNNSANSSEGSSASISSTELAAAQDLVNTYVVILTSRSVLNDVIEESGCSYSYDQLKTMISASPVNATQIFEIKVVSEDPQEAETIARCICKILPEKIADVIVGSSVRIVDEAVAPAQKSTPNVTKTTIFGLIAGFCLSVAGIIISELFDQYIRSEEYLLQTYADIPVLATIPDLDENTSKNRRYYSNRKKRE